MKRCCISKKDLKRYMIMLNMARLGLGFLPLNGLFEIYLQSASEHVDGKATTHLVQFIDSTKKH